MKLIRLSIYNKFKGCAGCPFVNEDGSPCNREKMEVQVHFKADNFQNGIGHKLWHRGDKVRASAVVIGGICFCAKTYSKVIPNVYDHIWICPGTMDVNLIVEDASKKNRKPSKWERRESRRQQESRNFNI